MKLIAPDYYTSFHCIAGQCRHTCCVGWEVDIDGESMERFRKEKEIFSRIDETGTPHFILSEDERCPFLNQDGLCRMILSKGEDYLCQICRDHPRFRNYFSDRTEIGLGMVCEEAAGLILSASGPMKLIVLEDDGKNEKLPEDEEWLIGLRDQMLASVPDTGPEGRLMEYLIYRHLSDALYDGKVEERIAFIEDSFREITEKWEKSDGSAEAAAEIARAWSYDVEYDEEELERRINREKRKR